jgi:hypothetical protein
MRYIVADRDQEKAVIWTGIAHDWKCAKPSDLAPEIVRRKYDDIVPRGYIKHKKLQAVIGCFICKINRI